MKKLTASAAKEGAEHSGIPVFPENLSDLFWQPFFYLLGMFFLYGAYQIFRFSQKKPFKRRVGFFGLGVLIIAGFSLGEIIRRKIFST